MILTQFPDLAWLKKQTNERFATGSILPAALRGRGWPNVVLNVKSANTVRDNIRGPLSIFTNFSGTTRVRAGNKNVLVKDNVFFISNHDQVYTLEVEKNSSAETCNVHFADYFIEEVFDAIKSSPAELLDNDFHPSRHLEFANQLRPLSSETNSLLKSISAIDMTSSTILEEKLFQLARLIMIDQREISRRQHLLPSIKNSTRTEIMRRLSFSTDYMYTHFGDSISLETLAEESQLSKFHFLRLFTHAFGKTPHQFITAIRMERAKTLLSTTKSEIKSVARDVGFINASSFSRLFHQHIGVYPSQFIRQAR
jgi:AraC family transcriptional regulator